MIVSLLGSTGHMGVQTLKEFLLLDCVIKVKVLLRKGSPRNKYVFRIIKKYKEKVEIVYGDITNKGDIKNLVEGSDYLFNLAAVIPPMSDKRPDLSYHVNELGVKNVVEVLEDNPKVKYIHISTIAVYGAKNYIHPFNRVGDPLIPSVYDVYSVHKMRAEFMILESKLNNFVILRQTAMIYLKMLTANMNDAIMFHTPFNDPLEWTTDTDSARLLASILIEEDKDTLNRSNFWNKIFNMGDLEENRVSGYQVLDDGFKLIGGTTKDFFKPYDNVTRNFHGGFYLDGLELDKLLHFKRDSLESYWERIKKSHPYFALARIVPKSLIRKFVIERLYKDPSSPKYWYLHNKTELLTAFFGSKEIYECQPREWKNFNKWDYKKSYLNKDYEPIDYGFDINKEDKDITYTDLLMVAVKHGGRIITDDFKTGDVYRVVEWENSDGERFKARPYTVLRGGHWWNPLYTSYTWDFDRLAKKDELYATYWYDSHEMNENNCYFMDEIFTPLLK